MCPVRQALCRILLFTTQGIESKSVSTCKQVFESLKHDAKNAFGCSAFSALEPICKSRKRISRLIQKFAYPPEFLSAARINPLQKEKPFWLFNHFGRFISMIPVFREVLGRFCMFIVHISLLHGLNNLHG